MLSILLSSQCLALATLLWVITGACVGRRRAYKYRDDNLIREAQYAYKQSTALFATFSTIAWALIRPRCGGIVRDLQVVAEQEK